MIQLRVSQGDKQQLVWVDPNDRVKVGKLIRFKDEDAFWTVEEMWYRDHIQKKELHKNWHVGGL